MTDFKQQLIDKIKEGDLEMKPRWHFVVQTAFFLAGIILSALIVVYLLSFITFVLQQNGAWFAPGYGWQGLMLFLLASPWIIIGFSFLFLGLLVILAHRYSFCYERPFLYTLLGVCSIALMGAYLAERAEFHPRMHVFLNQNNVPGLAPMYKKAETRPAAIAAGTISSFTENGFMLKTESDEMIRIVFKQNTKLAPEWKNEGINIMVFGNRASNTIIAIGVRPEREFLKTNRQQRATNTVETRR